MENEILIPFYYLINPSIGTQEMEHTQNLLSVIP